nr:transcription elongation factor Spt5 [Cryptomonas curvata]
MTISKKQKFICKLIVQYLNKNFFLMVLKKTFEKNFNLEFGSLPLTICCKFYKGPLLTETVFSILPSFKFDLWYLNDKIIYEQLEYDTKSKNLFHIESNISKINIQNTYCKKKNEFFKVKRIENDFAYKQNIIKQIEEHKIVKKNVFAKKNKSVQFSLKEKIHLKHILLPNPVRENQILKNKVNDYLYLISEGKVTLVKRLNTSYRDFISILRIKLHDLLYLDGNTLASIVVSYDKNSFGILETNGSKQILNINSIFLFKKIEKKSIRSNENFDFQGNIVFTGETVKILSGNYSNYTVIVKYIQFNYLYVFSKKIIENDGILCLKTDNIEIFLK